MARRQVHWWRYLCEGHTRHGGNCQGVRIVCAIDESNADRAVAENYDWVKVDGAWYCDGQHSEMVR